MTAGFLRAGLTVFPLALVVMGMVPIDMVAQGTGTVRGNVVDSRTSQPLGGILVQALGTRASVLTNDTGAFTLPEVPAEAVTVRFSWLGYRDHETQVDVPAGGLETIRVLMEVEPISLGEIRVTTVSRHVERVVESPASVASVEPGRVRDLAITGQAALVVADIPGVHVTQSGVNAFNVNVRGFNGLVNRRMLILLDGRDVSANFANSPEWPAISILEDGAKVELIRGPGSALYGANAFSGVLSILTPSVRQAQGTRLTVGGGSGSSLSVQGRHAAVTNDLRWGFRAQGNYATVATADRSRTNLGDLAAEYAGVGALRGAVPQPGFELLPLSGQSKSSPFGVPGTASGVPDPMTTVSGSARIDHYLENGGAVTTEGGLTRVHNQVNASGGGRTQIHESTVPWARLALDVERFSAMAYYGGRRGEQTSLANGQDFEDNYSRLHAEAQTNAAFAGGRGQMVLGASVRRETIDSKGTVLAPEYDGRSDEYYGAFGQVEFDLVDQLRLTLVGRYDGASLFDPQFAPRAALVFSPDETQSMRVTYGRAYLMPSAAQRFVRFPLGPPADLNALEAGLRASPLGPALLGVPNGTLFTNSGAVPVLTIGADLDPEEVTALEVGYKIQSDKVFFSADVHYSDYESFFTGLLPGVHSQFGPWTAPAAVPAAARAGVELAAADVPGLTRLEDGSTAIVFAQGNAGAATQWGLDVSGAVQVDDRLRLQAGYSYVSVDFEDGSIPGGDSIPSNTPEHTASGSATYSRTDGLRARIGLTLVSGYDFRDGAWEGGVPSRQTVDLSLGHPLGERLFVGLSATNLFDEKRYHYFGGSMIPRRLLVSLTWEP